MKDSDMDGLTLDTFDIPMSAVSLSKSEQGKNIPWLIEGLASNASEDQQKEIVLAKGLDLSYFESGKGTLNWNHAGDKDPSSVIGLVIDHRRTDEGELFIKGKLLKSVPKAQAAYSLLKALDEEGEQRRMGMSIEGKVLHRQNKVIYKAWVKAVALTMDPVNPDTYVKFAKSFEGAELAPSDPDNWMGRMDATMLERALSIASTSAGSPSGRSILSQEDLEGDMKDLDWAGGNKSSRNKTKREKIVKGFTFDEAVKHIQLLDPRYTHDIAAGIVRFAFTQQEKAE